MEDFIRQIEAKLAALTNDEAADLAASILVLRRLQSKLSGISISTVLPEAMPVIMPMMSGMAPAGPAIDELFRQAAAVAKRLKCERALAVFGVL